jgi:hypothetical protein
MKQKSSTTFLELSRLSSITTFQKHTIFKMNPVNFTLVYENSTLAKETRKQI